jgi:hypothetical protein
MDRFMNFERGLDPKEALSVGLKANAQYIQNVYRIIPEFDFPTGIVRKTMNIVNDTEVLKILEGISHGELFVEDFAFEIMDKDIFSTGSLKFFKDFRGKYLKYREQIMRRDTYHGYDCDIKEYIFLIPS